MEFEIDKEAVPSTSHSVEKTPGKTNTRKPKPVKDKITLPHLLKVICSSQETCIEWLKDNDFIPKSMTCPDCRSKMKFEAKEDSIDNYVWICKNCRNEPSWFSIRRGSWFEDRNAYLIDILLFTYLWTNSYNEVQIAQETNMEMEIVRDWITTCESVCEEVLLKNKNEDDDSHNLRPSKESPIAAWRKKSKNKDPFLEFLKDANSLETSD